MSNNSLIRKYFRSGTRLRVFIAIASVLVAGILLQANNDWFTSDIKLSEAASITRAIRQSRSYLVNHSDENGMFVYRVNMNPDVNVSRKYNILRHAGTIYALSMYYDLHPDPEVKNVINRSVRYLLDDAIDSVPGKENMFAVWSMPEVNRNSKVPEAKLGGAGLGLVALLSAERIYPGITSLGTLRGLGNFIVSMQKEDGSFYSKYIPSSGGPDDSWTSLYYPGEAALGLLMLYEKDGSEIWLDAAYKALIYLAEVRKGKNNIPADHWALLATEKLLTLEGYRISTESKGMLVNHTKQICESILEDHIPQSDTPERAGGFSKDGRTAPAATRLEGLLAAKNIIPDEEEICERIDAAIKNGISFLLRAQVKDGQFAGGIPRAVSQLKGSSSRVNEFNRRSTEIRIDYVQHAMCSMMQYMK